MKAGLMPGRASRLTRARAEGRACRLPAGEAAGAFARQVSLLRRDPTCLLEVLRLAQETFGFLSPPVLGWVAQELRMPRSQVYGAATFYSLFCLKEEARYIIRVCDSLSCHLNGGDEIAGAVRRAARIPPAGARSHDGLFLLRSAPCLGLCDLAPAMMVNHRRYGFLTAATAYQVVAELRRREAGG